MPRFVILEHDHPELHWDFMLETEGVLKTWRLSSFPQPAEVGQRWTAVAIADHRLLYLNYEGPVSGDRGQVVRRDQGSYDLCTTLIAAAPEPALGKADRLILGLAGQHLRGTFALTRVAQDNWRLEFLAADQR